MEVYRRGPADTESTVDYVIIVRGDDVFWCHSDGKTVTGYTGNIELDKWVKSCDWSRVRQTKAMKVALKLCKPEDVYKVVTSLRRKSGS